MHRLDIISFVIFFWCAINVLWALVPDRFVVDYQVLEAQDPLCINEKQNMSGYKIVHTDLDVSGIDKVINNKSGEPEYRWDWKSIYKSGEPQSHWKEDPELGEGSYHWEANIKVHVTGLIPKSIGPIISNDFEVITCE